MEEAEADNPAIAQPDLVRNLSTVYDAIDVSVDQSSSIQDGFSASLAEAPPSGYGLGSEVAHTEAGNELESSTVELGDEAQSVPVDRAQEIEIGVVPADPPSPRSWRLATGMNDEHQSEARVHFKLPDVSVQPSADGRGEGFNRHAFQQGRGPASQHATGALSTVEGLSQRSLVYDSSRRVGLQPGDVIALLNEGCLYRVNQVSLEELQGVPERTDQPSVMQYVLEPSNETWPPPANGLGSDQTAEQSDMPIPSLRGELPPPKGGGNGPPPPPRESRSPCRSLAGSRGSNNKNSPRERCLSPFRRGMDSPRRTTTDSSNGSRTAVSVIGPQSHLEVVKQGDYLGLRSAAAGWRFVQPRKRAPHTLVFFNTKCGIWEQWEVVTPVDFLSHPWSLMPLTLRSRRLPHICLSFEVARVGSYVAPSRLPFVHPAGETGSDVGLHVLLDGQQFETMPADQQAWLHGPAGMAAYAAATSAGANPDVTASALATAAAVVAGLPPPAWAVHSWGTASMRDSTFQSSNRFQPSWHLSKSGMHSRSARASNEPTEQQTWLQEPHAAAAYAAATAAGAEPLQAEAAAATAAAAVAGVPTPDWAVQAWGRASMRDSTFHSSGGFKPFSVLRLTKSGPQPKTSSLLELQAKQDEWMMGPHGKAALDAAAAAGANDEEAQVAVATAAAVITGLPAPSWAVQAWGKPSMRDSTFQSSARFQPSWQLSKSGGVNRSPRTSTEPEELQSWLQEPVPAAAYAAATSLGLEPEQAEAAAATAAATVEGIQPPEWANKAWKVATIHELAYQADSPFQPSWKLSKSGHLTAELADLPSQQKDWLHQPQAAAAFAAATAAGASPEQAEAAAATAASKAAGIQPPTWAVHTWSKASLRDSTFQSSGRFQPSWNLTKSGLLRTVRSSEQNGEQGDWLHGKSAAAAYAAATAAGATPDEAAAAAATAAAVVAGQEPPSWAVQSYSRASLRDSTFQSSGRFQSNIQMSLSGMLKARSRANSSTNTLTDLTAEPMTAEPSYDTQTEGHDTENEQEGNRALYSGFSEQLQPMEYGLPPIPDEETVAAEEAAALERQAFIESMEYQLQYQDPAVQEAAVSFLSDTGSPHATWSRPHSPNASYAAQPGSELGEDENLRRISGLLVQEWFRFVDVEKTERRRIDGDVADLVSQLRDMRAHSFHELAVLRNQIHDELTGMAQQVHDRDVELATSKNIRRRALTAAVGALWRRQALQATGAMFATWHDWAYRRSYIRKAAARNLEASKQRLMQNILYALADRIAARNRLGVLLIRGLFATSRRKMQDAFNQWQLYTTSQQQGRKALQAMAHRSDTALLRITLNGWQAVVHNLAACTAKVEQICAKRASGLQQQVLLSWQAVSNDIKAKRARMLRTAMWHESRTVRCAFSWLTAWAHSKKQLRDSETAVAKRQTTSLQLKAIAAWHSACMTRSIHKRKVAILSSRQVSRYTQHAFGEWKAVTIRSKASKAVIHSAHQRRMSSTQRKAFASLRYHADLRRALNHALARGRQRTLARAWYAWWQRCFNSASAQQHLASALRSVQRHRLRSALHEWRWLALQRTARRWEKLTALPTATNVSLTLGLGQWWLTCNLASCSHPLSDHELTTSDGLTDDALQQGDTSVVYDDINGTESWSIGAVTDTSVSQQPLQRMNSKQRRQQRRNAARKAAKKGDVSVDVHGSPSSSIGGSLNNNEKASVLSHPVIPEDVLSHDSQKYAREEEVSSADELIAAWNPQAAVAGLPQRPFLWLLRCAFVNWKLATHAARDQLEVSVCHHGAKQIRSTQQLFFAWRSICSHLQHARNVASTIAMKGEQARLYQVFTAWNETVQHSARQYKEVACSTQLKRMQSCWAAWKQHTVLAQAISALNTHGRVWRARRMLANSWSCWVQEARKSADAQVTADCHWRQYTQRMTLQGWREAAGLLQHRRQRHNQILRSASGQRQRHLLWSWNEYVQGIQHARVQADIHACKHGLRLTAACWSAWRDHTDNVQQARGCAEQMGQSRDSSLVASCFDAWHRVYDSLKTARDACNAMYTRGNTQLLSNAWEAWVAVTFADGTSTDTMPYHGHVTSDKRLQKRALHRCFQQWRSLVRSSQYESHVLDRAASHHASRTQREVLRTWSMLATVFKAQRIALDRHRARADERMLCTHFYRWQRVAADSKRRTELLKACIKRKKVAFQQFKSWYWESFDADVQATIQRMFYTTEQAMADRPGRLPPYQAPHKRDVSPDRHALGFSPRASLSSIPATQKLSPQMSPSHDSIRSSFANSPDVAARRNSILQNLQAVATHVQPYVPTNTYAVSSNPAFKSQQRPGGVDPVDGTITNKVEAVENSKPGPQRVSSRDNVGKQQSSLVSASSFKAWADVEEDRKSGDRSSKNSNAASSGLAQLPEGVEDTADTEPSRSLITESVPTNIRSSQLYTLSGTCPAPYTNALFDDDDDDQARA